MNHPECRLCASPHIAVLEVSFKGRNYYLCQDCQLIQTAIKDLPDAEVEKRRYDGHQNESNNLGYVKFLQQIIDPVLPLLSPSMEGLDYGCGPGTVLADILRTKGFHCDRYDPYYFPQFPDKKYDFIFAVECFEHFFKPINDIKKIISVMKSGALLAVMTEIWHDLDSFADWYYIRDITHVSFYHRDSLSYVEEKFGLEMIYSDSKRVFIFRKTSG